MHGCLLICALFTEIQLIPVGNGLGLGSVCAPACTSQNFGLWRYDAEGCFFYYILVEHTYCTAQRTLNDLQEMRLIFFLRALLEKDSRALLIKASYVS